MQRRQLVSTLGTCLAAPALTAWSGSAAAQATGVSDTRIVLGQSAPFSGAAEQLGVQFYLGPSCSLTPSMPGEASTGARWKSDGWTTATSPSAVPPTRAS
jgi:hypothetical protein